MTDDRLRPQHHEPRNGDVIVSVRDLSVRFAAGNSTVHAVRGVDLDIRRGEVTALVGESGSGKSTVVLALMGLLAPNATVSGSITFDGTELVGAPPVVLRRLRGARVGMVFQDPMTSLNPMHTVGRQLAEAVRVHRRISAKDAARRAVELLDLVAVPHASQRVGSYPHELSGGMRQRVMIAMAIANDPDLLIADEPTTALDVTIQAQVLDVLERLRDERRLAIALVTHDLGVVAGVADSVNVMYAGSLVEQGDVRDVFYRAVHPYTLGLLACSPRLDRPGELVPIAGSPPVLTELPAGCAFAQRCERAVDGCHVRRPVLRPVGATRAACDLVGGAS
jgi:peptide/nickel transport system permease protein